MNLTGLGQLASIFRLRPSDTVKAGSILPPFSVLVGGEDPGIRDVYLILVSPPSPIQDAIVRVHVNEFMRSNKLGKGKALSSDPV